MCGGEIDEGRVGGIRGEGICSDRKEVKGTKVDDWEIEKLFHVISRNGGVVEEEGWGLGQWRRDIWEHTLVTGHIALFLIPGSSWAIFLEV